MSEGSVNEGLGFGAGTGRRDSGPEPSENSVVTSQSGEGSGVQDNRTVRIPMVRDKLRAADVPSYKPHTVSIGPYHLSCSSLGLQEEKQLCVDFLQSLLEGSTEEDNFTNGIKDMEPKVRACYPGGVGDLTAVELSRMLLRDGCFLLACTNKYPRRDTNDGATQEPLVSGNGATMPAQIANVLDTSLGSVNTLVRDTVFLLENQIPFFVLEWIHNRVTGRTNTLAQEMKPYIRDLLEELLFISPCEPQSLVESPSHILHLVHSYFVGAGDIIRLFNRRNDDVEGGAGGDESEDGRRRPRMGRWRRATEYCRYGNVLFKRRLFKGDDKWSILDVCLQGRTLWIPHLRVDSNTWTILRNLMALEDDSKPTGRLVTAYCVFMSQVASKVEDVELLQRQGILEQFLGSDEDVAKGFAALCQGVVLDIDNLEMNYLNPMWHDLRKRCNHRYNYWIGSFLQKYWSDPMYQAALVTASILFIFQLAQTILSLIQVLQNRKSH